MSFLDRTQTHTHLVGLLWTSDGPFAETCTGNSQHSKRQTSFFRAGLEPAIATSEQQQTNALDRVDTGTDTLNINAAIFSELLAPVYQYTGSNFSNCLNFRQHRCGKVRPRAGFLLLHKIPLSPSLITDRYQAFFQE